MIFKRAKVVSHGRYVAFQMAEVAIPRQMFQEPGNEARSLHGAFHVFEAHFGDFLLV